MTRNLGHTAPFLTIEIEWLDSHTTALRQSKLAEKMLVTQGMERSAKAKCPMKPMKNDLNKKRSLENNDSSVYRSMVCNLLFVVLE